MLAWSLNNGLTFPFNFYFVFIFMAATHAVGACMSFLLPPTYANIERERENAFCLQQVGSTNVLLTVRCCGKIDTSLLLFMLFFFLNILWAPTLVCTWMGCE